MCVHFSGIPHSALEILNNMKSIILSLYKFVRNRRFINLNKE